MNGDVDIRLLSNFRRSCFCCVVSLFKAVSNFYSTVRLGTTTSANLTLVLWSGGCGALFVAAKAVAVCPSRKSFRFLLSRIDCISAALSPSCFVQLW